jgi:hypothetical protein
MDGWRMKDLFQRIFLLSDQMTGTSYGISLFQIKQLLGNNENKELKLQKLGQLQSRSVFSD